MMMGSVSLLFRAIHSGMTVLEIVLFGLITLGSDRICCFFFFFNYIILFFVCIVNVVRF